MKKVFSSNEAIMIAHYKGLNVKELDKIRNEMRENGIFFKVTKNRITKLALKETKCKDLEKFLQDQLQQLFLLTRLHLQKSWPNMLKVIHI